jgi:hypothetical protein
MATHAWNVVEGMMPALTFAQNSRNSSYPSLPFEFRTLGINIGFATLARAQFFITHAENICHEYLGDHDIPKYRVNAIMLLSFYTVDRAVWMANWVNSHLPH